MPIITVFPDVIRAYNRVDIDWSDTPTVEWAKVTRVDAETGECTPLRPYVCFMGDYLNVSCDSHGVFWDTEVPLDRSVYYITEGLDADLQQPCIAAAPVIFDSFSRILVDSWGSPEIGLSPWVNANAAAADFDVNGTRGTHTLPAVNVLHFSTTDLGQADFEVYAEVLIPATATGASFTPRLIGRFTDVNNNYQARLVLQTTGSVDIDIAKLVGGVGSVVGGPALGIGNYAATTVFAMRFVGIGSTLRAKAWRPSLESEPATFQVTSIDTSLTTGNGVGVATRADAGNTNGTVIFGWDDFTVPGDCLPCTPVTATTVATPTIMPSNGAFRLKDPVRPCNDLYVPLCFDQVPDPSCLPGSGIFFASMDTEVYDSNTLVLNPTNARRPIAVNRQRRDKASLLQLVTRTFADRDALLNINEPGSPLLLQGPPNYGIPGAYISIGDISIERGLSDHRFPVRVNNLPFVTVNRPAGPSQGVCGSRVEDTCDIYTTWSALTATGMSYEDIVRGRASNDDVGQRLRTWDDVQAEFVDWNAVEANGTWAQLEAGE